MESIEEKENDADADDKTQDDGISSFPQIYPLHKAVDHREAIWQVIKETTTLTDNSPSTMHVWPHEPLKHKFQDLRRIWKMELLITQ